MARTFQEVRLVHELSVWDNLLLAFPRSGRDGLFAALMRPRSTLRGHGDAGRAEELLQMGDLASKRAHLAEELSYGEQKLLNLLCCFAMKTRILMLDEPIAGVHGETGTRILELIRRLAKDGKLVVFAEHDIASVRSVADLVLVMDQGRIVAHGTPTDILGRHETMEAYTGQS